MQQINLKEKSIVNLLQNSGVLIDGITEAVKHEIQKQEGGLLTASFTPLAASVLQPVFSSVTKLITERGVMGAERGYYNNIDKNL